MLVLQSLASSHVSMVIVAGDPFTATNSKKEEKKFPGPDFSLYFHRLFPRQALPCCISVTSLLYIAQDHICLNADLNAEQRRPSGCCASCTYFSTLECNPQGLLLQPLQHKNTCLRAAFPSRSPCKHTSTAQGRSQTDLESDFSGSPFHPAIVCLEGF